MLNPGVNSSPSKNAVFQNLQLIQSLSSFVNHLAREWLQIRALKQSMNANEPFYDRCEPLIPTALKEVLDFNQSLPQETEWEDFKSAINDWIVNTASAVNTNHGGAPQASAESVKTPNENRLLKQRHELHKLHLAMQQTLLEKSKSVLAKSSESEHQQTHAAILVSVALAQLELGIDFIKSRAHLLEAIQIRENIKAPNKNDTFDLAAAMFHLARLQLRTGQGHQMACATMQSAIQILEDFAKDSGCYDMDLLWFKFELAKAYLASNRPEAALLTQQALELARKVLPPGSEDPHLLIPIIQLQASVLQAANAQPDGDQRHLDAMRMLRNNFAHDKMQEVNFIYGIGQAASLTGGANTAMFRDVTKMGLQRLWTMGGALELAPEERVSHIKRNYATDTLIALNQEQKPEATSSSVLDSSAQGFKQAFFRTILNDPDLFRFGRLTANTDLLNLLQQCLPSINNQQSALSPSVVVAMRQLAENPRVIDRRNLRLDTALMHQWIRQFTNISHANALKLVDRMSPHMTHQDIDATLSGEIINHIHYETLSAESARESRMDNAQLSNPNLCLRSVGNLVMQSGITIMLRVSPQLGMRLIDAGLAMLRSAHKVSPDTTLCWALSSYAIALARCSHFGTALEACQDALNTHESLGLPEQRKQELRAQLTLNSAVVSRYVVAVNSPCLGHVPTATTERLQQTAHLSAPVAVGDLLDEHEKRTLMALDSCTAAPTPTVASMLTAYDELAYARLLRRHYWNGVEHLKLGLQRLAPYFPSSETTASLDASQQRWIIEQWLVMRSNLALQELAGIIPDEHQDAVRILSECVDVAERNFMQAPQLLLAGNVPACDFVRLLQRNLNFAKFIANGEWIEQPGQQAAKHFGLTASRQRIDRELIYRTELSAFPIGMLGITVLDDNEFAEQQEPSPSSHRRIPEASVPLFLTAISSKMSRMIAVKRETHTEYLHRKKDATRLFSITKNRVAVYRRINPPFELFARYVLPHELRTKANRIIEHTQEAPRHPNIFMTLVAVKHRDGTVDIDLEYADGGTMMAFIPRFANEHRELVALSVIRQVLQAIAYLDTVHKGQRHRHICPRYVYLRRDGCVKLDVPEMFDKETVEKNQAHFLESPYTAPECRTLDTFFAGDHRSDLWSLGVLIIGIMTGLTLQPRRKAQRAGDNIPSDPLTDDEIRAYNSECDAFNALVQSNDDSLWRQYAPNDYIRFFVRRFLQDKPENRGTAMEALALTYAFGGVIEATTAQEIESAIIIEKSQFSTAFLAPSYKQSRDATTASPNEQGAAAAAAASAAQATTSDNHAATAGVFYEQPLLDIFDKKLPHPWALDPSQAFVNPKAPTLEQTGIHLSNCLRRNPENPYKLPEDSRGQSELVVGNNLQTNVVVLEQLLKAELVSWRNAREMIKGATDRDMREVLRNRSQMLWRGMSYAVDWVRAERERRKEALLETGRLEDDRMEDQQDSQTSINRPGM